MAQSPRAGLPGGRQREAQRINQQVAGRRLARSGRAPAVRVKIEQELVFGRHSAARMGPVEQQGQTARTEAAGKDATELRKQTLQLVEDAKDGLRAQVQGFTELAGTVDKESQAAATGADGAAKDYSAAIASFGRYRGTIREGATAGTIPPTSPLPAIANDARTDALLQLRIQLKAGECYVGMS